MNVENEREDDLKHLSKRVSELSVADLRSIIRSEMEYLYFSSVCDELGKEELANSGVDVGPEPELAKEETMVQADRRRKKRWAKKRDEWRKEIKKKREQRHKCKSQRQNMNEEVVFDRWRDFL